MTTQYEPAKPNLINAMLRLPAFPVEDQTKIFILRLLVIERIRCYIDNLDFSEARKEIIKKYTKIPTAYNSESEKERYLDSELVEMISVFDRYEMDPLLKADFESLKPYRGHVWHLGTATEHAIVILIEV